MRSSPVDVHALEGHDDRNLGALLTEMPNPRTDRIDLGTAEEIISAILKDDKAILHAVAQVKAQMAAAADLIAQALAAGGRLIYVGAGTSGRLGVLDAAECPPTFGTPPEMVQAIIAGGPKALFRAVEGAEDRGDLGARAVRKRRPSPINVFFGITACGTTPFVVQALKTAKKLGAKTILLAFNPVEDHSLYDICIAPIVGPEVIAGSTRMKAGTATKIILNTISTTVMIRLGKVYRNFMVDLRRTSRKLEDRAVRIVAAITGLGNNDALQLLDRAGGNAKTAIVMWRRNVSRERAEQLLEENNGMLRRVIE